MDGGEANDPGGRWHGREHTALRLIISITRVIFLSRHNRPRLPAVDVFRYLYDLALSGSSPQFRRMGSLSRQQRLGNFMGFLNGKRALIVGLASNRSIAWGIAQAMHREGAMLAFTYQNAKLADRVAKLAAEVNTSICLACDVGNDEEIAGAFKALGEHWDGLDIVVHSVAYAPSEQLDGDYLDCVTREGFRIAHDISSYSFAALAKAGRPMMQGRNGALLTLSYLGAMKTVPNYNVMGLAKASLEANVRYLARSLGPQGIRVNGISAGPIRTLAASGISNFRKMLDQFAGTAPLRRNVTIEDVGNAAAFLCSDLAGGITGEIIYVDGGYSTVGMGPLD
jgi:enoyl-[acyl-carrier protein] reductase I